MSLKLIVLNVARLAWKDPVIGFLEQERPDAMMFQEFPRKDIRDFERHFDMTCHCAVSGRHPDLENDDLIEICTFTKSRGPCSAWYYRGSEADAITSDPDPKFRNHALLAVECTDATGSSFRLVNTHFPWSADGKPNGVQWETLPAMLKMLSLFGHCIFAGDLNAPRGGPIFEKIAGRYTDWVPVEHTTSIDPDLHRAGALQLMVDGVFSTDPYCAEEVRLEFGVSDHAAIVAVMTARV